MFALDVILITFPRNLVILNIDSFVQLYQIFNQRNVLTLSCIHLVTNPFLYLTLVYMH